ncbi:unnamed protein product [Caretta caretta]
MPDQRSEERATAREAEIHFHSTDVGGSCSSIHSASSFAPVGDLFCPRPGRWFTSSNANRPACLLLAV